MSYIILGQENSANIDMSIGIVISHSNKEASVDHKEVRQGLNL